MSKASKRLLSILSILMFVGSVTMLVLLLINRDHTHKWATAWTTDVEYHWHVCENGCKEQSEKAKHTYGDWTTTKDPTETEKGTRERTCTVCDYKETGTIDELNHTHVWNATIEYSGVYDETSGVYTFTATRTCEKNTEHKQTVTSISSSSPRVDKAATCVAKGLTTYTVSFDDNWSGTTDKFTETHDIQVETPIDTVNGHKVSETAVWKHNDKKHWHECENGCGKHFGEDDHSLLWTTTTPAGDDSDGIETGTCVCGYYETRTIPAGHTHEWSITYDWSGDHKTVTANGVCKDPAHTFTVTSTSVEENTVTPANCTYAETHECTVTFPADSFIGGEAQSVSYTVGDKLNNGGHVFLGPDGSDFKVGMVTAGGGIGQYDQTIAGFYCVDKCIVCEKKFGKNVYGYGFNELRTERWKIESVHHKAGEIPQGLEYELTFEEDTTACPATCSSDGLRYYRVYLYRLAGVDISWMNGENGYYLYEWTDRNNISDYGTQYNLDILPKNPDAHYDTSKWEFDATGHWNPRYADCTHTDQPEKGNYVSHTFVNGVCGTCGYHQGMTFALSDDGSYYTLSGYTGTATDIVIPERFDGKPVTAIGDNAFKDNATITSVVIPGTVTTIGETAFSGCTALDKVFYKGKNAAWEAITGNGKTVELTAKVYYYSGIMPTDTAHKYWYYGADGAPKVWGA